MFETIDYLQYGNEKQRLAYNAIRGLRIIEYLKEYTPILCGTLPIGIDLEGSDLDIIMRVVDFDQFEDKVKSLYRQEENFKLKRRVIREIPVIKANFIYGGFEFELFGQPKPVHEQFAYLHMIIENHILKENPHIREEILNYKNRGYKTEAAFCKVLKLKGDPYIELLQYGRNLGII
ncbi:hypothetical protein HNQ94_000778 [Salirhabdus euzebyi]|uniref:DUF4269 domain-containing protein n=1 Tax=Salirhabdus euzebyi TaxID=394506 RepID=A0A841Q1S3_9BACI|nr:DUF4269 domain-containing protein [Salirhabdus euzebyi]MBB6452333.1 hypothetical protein [Salirhabdus euzebyi]